MPSPNPPQRRRSARFDERIVDAWRELRRVDTMAAYRDILFQGADRAQVDALDVLARQDGTRMVDLAAALRIEKSTATRAVERLEKAGLASRKTSVSPGSGRAVVVTLTERGTELHENIVVRRLKLVRDILRDFGSEDKELLATLMERMVAGWDHLGGMEAGEGTA